MDNSEIQPSVELQANPSFWAGFADFLSEVYVLNWAFVIIGLLGLLFGNPSEAVVDFLKIALPAAIPTGTIRMPSAKKA